MSLNVKAVPPVIKTPPPGPPARLPLPADPPRRRGMNRRNSERLFRVIVIIMLVFSIGMAWFSYSFMLVPKQEESRRLTRELAKVSASVDELDRAWTPGQMIDLTNKLNQVSSMLFTDEQSLASWLEAMHQEAAPLGMELSPTFSAPESPATNDTSLAVVPLTVAVEVKPGSENSGMPSRYKRLMQLVESTAAAERRTDIAELVVAGGTNSTDKTVMVLHLWAREEEAK